MIPAMLQVAELRAAYRARALDPEQVARAVLERRAAYPDPAIWISMVPDEALLERARALAGDPSLAETLPLYGQPFAVKDNIDVAGMETTAACPEFAYRAERDAEVVRRLVEAGAMVVGKANLDQFATGLNGTRSPYGAPRCVFDADYISGGSSSGSGVAVAAGLVSFALGTDTAGSGRVPAALNNIVGLKPTKGLLSTTGLVPACRSIDCISIFAASVGDAREVLAVVEGFDPNDPFSRPKAPTRLRLEGVRFGVLAGEDRDFCGDAEAEALYDAAIARMENLGWVAAPIDYTPFRESAALLYEGPFVAERLASIESFFGQHADAVDPAVRVIIEGAKAFSAVDMVKAEYRLRALGRPASSAFATVDVLLLPTCPTTFTVAAMRADPVRLNSQLGLYTNFVNLLDYAALAVPAGFRASNGLPFGVTLVGPAFSDDDLAVLGDRLHRALGEGVGRERAAIAAAPVAPEPEVSLAVAGAHLSRMPLNHQLLDLGGRLVRTVRTAADYRLLALPGTTPAKPGLARTPGFVGPGIEVEVWSLSESAFGRFVAALPTPMGIGRVTLQDGTTVPGFLCEAHALDGAEDITHFGGWRAFVESKVSH